MLQTVQPRARPSRAKIASGSWKPRERPLTLQEIVWISRKRIDKLSWSVIAKKMGRSSTQLQNTWSAHSPQWASDTRLPIDVRAYLECRCILAEAKDAAEAPRTPDLDAIYWTACVAAGGFAVCDLPPRYSLDFAKLIANRLVIAAAR